MSRRGAAFDNSTFVSRNGDFILFIVISILSLATITIIRSSHVKNLSPFSLLQKGVVILSDTIDGIGLHAERIEELNDQYERLLSNLEIYQYATQISGYQQQNADRLKESVAFSSTLKFDNLIARVIARDPNQIFRAFTIDKGSNEGIELEMPVVAIQDGLAGLMGKVEHVAQDSAIVQPIIDERSTVIAEHIETQLAGIMSGGAADAQILTLDFVDAREIERIRSGDLVVTSRFSSVYPPNIPIGTVQPFRKARNSDQAIIEVRPILNFNRLNYVVVLLPNEIFSE